MNLADSTAYARANRGDALADELRDFEGIAFTWMQRSIRSFKRSKNS